ncbi:MAG: hypothetical protein M1327_06625 [Candidatus Thermoplasmatota archaeon]|nr:hypothetical protein [Candidatus Thermoplasmatota archaeon]
MARLQKKLKQLLNDGYSANKIAKLLHKRKQDVLAEIRKIQNKPINPKKITNPKGRIGSIELDLPSKAFTEALYKQGYPIEYIVKLVNKKHSETSKAKIRRYLKEYKKNNPEALDSHNANMRLYKAMGKYKQHIDAKFFRETKEHYFQEFDSQFKEGSPTIEIDLAEEG